MSHLEGVAGSLGSQSQPPLLVERVSSDEGEVRDLGGSIMYFLCHLEFVSHLLVQLDQGYGVWGMREARQVGATANCCSQ